MHLLAEQMRPKDEYKDPGVLPKVNKADMAGLMEAIKACHSVMRAPLAYIMRKTIIVETYGDYPKYATPDDKMMLGCYTYLQTRTSCTRIKVLSQPRNIQQSTR